MRFLAAAGGITVDDLPKDLGDGVGGAVAVGFDENGDEHGLVVLPEDLADDSRTDILAFGIALAAERNLVANAPGGHLGIAREPLRAASSGIGHVAWHLARSCGRDTPSATFELVILSGPAAGERMKLPGEVPPEARSA